MNKRVFGTVIAVASVFGVGAVDSQVDAAFYKMTDLAAANILWGQHHIGRSSSGGCTDRNNPTCTSYQLINSSTVFGVVGFKNASGCPVVITGGTEAGHAAGAYSHWNGYKVDISPTACVGNFITSRYVYAGRRGDGAPMYQSPSGAVYARESNHWDVLYPG
jgi:hypothetical protein